MKQFVKQIPVLLIISVLLAPSLTAWAEEIVGMDMDHAKQANGGHDAEMQKQRDAAMGKMIYKMACAKCHGINGKGDGPAAIFIGPYSSPRPRDFYRGVFKFRTTEPGHLPTTFDLMRTVRDGIPGFMPAFGGLGREKLRQVILYVSHFYKRKTDRKIKSRGKAYREITIDHSESFTRESISRGKKAYMKLGCAKCHGVEGKGDGESANTLKSDSGLPIKPADLTMPLTFKNGNNHEDIYRTIMTGLNGTPMPSYADSLKDDDAKAWDLVHYVLSLSPDEVWTRTEGVR